MVEYFRNVDSVFFFYVIIISVICAYLCQTCERIFAFSFCFHHSLAVFSLLRRNRIWIYPGELILHIFDENQALKWNLWDLFAHCFHVCWLFSSFKVPGWREDWHKIVGEMFVESGVCVCVCARVCFNLRSTIFCGVMMRSPTVAGSGPFDLRYFLSC